MKKGCIFFFVAILIMSSCSSGRRALERGDYFSAVLKSVQRLRSDPDNRKATQVLDNSYDLALTWSQEEMDRIMTTNEPFKWGRAVDLMEQMNHLADEIRQSPAARQVVPDPKVYTSELNTGREKAAGERYDAGVAQLAENTRESARGAYQDFVWADQYIKGFRDVAEKIIEAKTLATLTVILEAIPVHAVRYKLSSGFFYNKVFEFLNNKFPDNSFVNFYSPQQAEKLGLTNPDMIVRLEFFDFVVGNSEHSEKEEQVKRRVQVVTKDTSKVVYKNYTARIKTFTDKVNSGGVLDVKIIETGSAKLMMNDRIPGSFTWVNQYAMYVGDKEALDKNQIMLVNRKVVAPPDGQDLFIEFTKPIFDRLTGNLYRFFSRYN